MLSLEFVRRPTGYYWEFKRGRTVLATHARPFKSYKEMHAAVVTFLAEIQCDEFEFVDATGENRILKQPR